VIKNRFVDVLASDYSAIWHTADVESLENWKSLKGNVMEAAVGNYDQIFDSGRKEFYDLSEMQFTCRLGSIKLEDCWLFS
jgi:hypothetical protein